VRAVEPADLPAVRKILAHWIDHDLEERLDEIGLTIGSGDASHGYVVAVEGGEVVGVAGFNSKRIDPALATADDNPVELVGAYVSPCRRGTGAGRALATAVEERVAALGYQTLVVVSGSRNREFGYPFWHRRYGEPARWDDDHFGVGAERVVWRRPLGGGKQHS
jgi:GNAT superfamily N-acetyltransferase